jgi:hypothetical protein
MPAKPFLILAVRGKKEVLALRQKARLVARLLHYEPREQTCIAAGAFAVAQQAWGKLGEVQICFHIDQDHFHIFAQTRSQEASETAADSGLLRLTKPLPSEKRLSDVDVAFLVSKMGSALAGNLFDEIVKQNHEVLTLLQELQSCQAYAKAKEEPTNPSAA